MRTTRRCTSGLLRPFRVAARNYVTKLESVNRIYMKTQHNTRLRSADIAISTGLIQGTYDKITAHKRSNFVNTPKAHSIGTHTLSTSLFFFKRI